jgi:hypothetical protein
MTPPCPARSRRSGSHAFLIVALGLRLTGDPAGAQSLTYSRGQNVSPAYEGWEQNPDGSFNFLFGYMNRNWEEEIDVPIGPDNSIAPGQPDQGQPTHFLPRRNRFVFKVRVPADWGEKEMIWTLTTRGKTERAYATLRIDSKVDDVVKASETGALGAGTSSPEIRSNKPPAIKLDGMKTRTVKVGQPVTLAAWVTDDGIPKPRSVGPDSTTNTFRRAEGEQRRITDPAYLPPRQSTVGKRLGLHLSWFVYRGAGAVGFRSPTDQSLGGHPDRFEFAVGASVATSGASGGRQVDHHRDVQGARYLCAAGARRRRRVDVRRGRHDHRDQVICHSLNPFGISHDRRQWTKR